MASKLGIAAAVGISLCVWASAGAVPAAPPVPASRPASSKPATSKPAVASPLTLLMTDGTKVTGNIQSLDEAELVIKTFKGDQTIAMDQLQPVSVYAARKQFVDLTKGSAHLELGQYLLANGQNALGMLELTEAKRLDPSLKDEVETLRKAAAAEKAKAPVETVAAKDPKAATSQPDKVPKYIPATPEEVQANEKVARDMAQKAGKFIPTLHLIETPHFYIYSATERNNDRSLGELAEGMYGRLCQQFDIPVKDNIWAGKCPIYVMAKREQFVRFTIEVDQSQQGKAGGYNWSRGDGFCYIVMNAQPTRQAFQDTLVHEGTHAFISRFVNHRRIPSWLNEGLAETMAATINDSNGTNKRYISATRDAIREGRDVEHVFNGVELELFDYGIAQSYVRYLIARNRKSFVKLVMLLKEGKTEEEALKEAYNLTRSELLKDWKIAAAKAVG